jgi:transposase
MSKARLVITAVVTEGRSQADVARDYGVSKGWVSKLVARYRAEGETAFEPHSRRPKTNPTAIGQTVVDLIIRLRADLTGKGVDAGPDTIAWHLREHHQITVSPRTIARKLTAAGVITPEPKKRPRSSYIRFEADLPNECWQSDFTHYRLTTGADAEILTWLDDCTRYALNITAHTRVTGPSSSPPSAKALQNVAFLPPPAPTTAWSSPPASPAEKPAAAPSNTNYAGCTSSRKTAAPTTRPPAEKSNASNKP